jgi:hypothetical protein
MASPTQMHNVLCRSVTVEERFTASSRSSGSHKNWTDLYRASNSRVRGALWKALYVHDEIFMRSVYTKHVFVREKSSSVQPFPEVCGASRTNIWERDWVAMVTGHHFRPPPYKATGDQVQNKKLCISEPGPLEPIDLSPFENISDLAKGIVVLYTKVTMQQFTIGTV